MGRRHTGRKLAMQTLYQADLRGVEIDVILEEFIEHSIYFPETKDWTKSLSLNVWEKRDELDALIQKYAIDWDISRINPIDKNILRLAFYELIYSDLHKNMVLNEAIEIAKKYSDDDAPRFINGILGAYVEDHPKEEKSTPLNIES